MQVGDLISPMYQIYGEQISESKIFYFF